MTLERAIGVCIGRAVIIGMVTSERDCVDVRVRAPARARGVDMIMVHAILLVKGGAVLAFEARAWLIEVRCGARKSL